MAACMIAASMIGCESAFAQAGTLDPTFGNGGTILNGLARLTPGGELEATFGSEGTVPNTDPTPSRFAAAVVQPNGNIVVAGITTNSELFLSRYLGQ